MAWRAILRRVAHAAGSMLAWCPFTLLSLTDGRYKTPEGAVDHAILWSLVGLLACFVGVCAITFAASIGWMFAAVGYCVLGIALNILVRMPRFKNALFKAHKG